MNARIFFYPYDCGAITVGLTCEQKIYSCAMGDGDVQRCWLSVSDGEHVSSRPLSDKAFRQASALETLPDDDDYDLLPTDACYWDSRVVDYMLHRDNTQGTEIEFTCDGKPQGACSACLRPPGAFWMVALRSARTGGPYVAAWQEECLLR